MSASTPQFGILMANLVCVCALGCGAEEPNPLRGGSSSPSNSKSAYSDETVRRRQDVDSKALLSKIINAYGGKRLEAVERCRIKYEIETDIPGISNQDLPKTVIMEDWFDGPMRMKRVVHEKANGVEMLVTIINSPKMWVKNRSRTFIELPAPGGVSYPVVLSLPVQLMQHQQLGNRVSFVRISTKPNGEEYEMTIEQNGKTEKVNLIIDMKTHHVMRHRRQALNIARLAKQMSGKKPGKSALEASRTLQILEHRKFDGITLPSRLDATQNSRVVFSISVIEFEILERLPQNMFENPIK